MKIAAVTACIAGLAHTYMAASALKKAAEKDGYEIKVESQGSLGIKNKITEEDLKDTDLVILACDTRINGTDRFKDKPVFEVGVSDAVRNPKKVIDDALKLINK
ncbi:PTS fructose transporter subunit IIB [Clostridium sp. DMHC 10]|uniref:PTS fructose transporter subunit IIB n=1 Tax=Clostridium sp. DMHC 10 TaxID=747377 RepID=UPI00069FF2F5|nr:PTS fructose transporter subunit IIB [Clostridium sp. DMHC 10]KOF58275.1 PTS fructose transporter subunit IIB [Clostridium sp. DMHC 10]